MNKQNIFYILAMANTFDGNSSLVPLLLEKCVLKKLKEYLPLFQTVTSLPFFCNC